MIVNFLCMQAYLFNDYWEDIGTIKSFFDANLALTAQVRLFFLNDLTLHRSLIKPGTRYCSCLERSPGSSLST